MNPTPEQLLAEIEDIIRSMPPRAIIRHETDENLNWLGRASAAIALWNQAKAIAFDASVARVHAIMANEASQGLRSVQTILHQARHDLRMRTSGPQTLAVNAGGVFDYFDEIRKVIEMAKTDILFVDPYLDAEFVSRYLPHVSAGVPIRLLAREKLQMLIPAVELLQQQNGLPIAVRSAHAFHDRYIILDGSACYQSGSPFKDGAKKSPTTITQITDAFAAVSETYEEIWANATVHR